VKLLKSQPLKTNEENQKENRATMAKHLVYLLALLLTLAGCGTTPMYDEYTAIPKEGWHQDSSVQFAVEIDDVAARYYVEVSVRNNGNYPNRNLWLFRSITSSKGLEYQDTAQYFLADEYGAWTGKGLGELKNSDFPYKRQALQFREKGTYTFSFTQAMRTTQLQGIEDIGLRIYKQTPVNNGQEN
jgi:gliding motility-associated lipoprotein GldH